MSRLAQQVQAMTDQLRKESKKDSRAKVVTKMDDQAGNNDNDLVGDDLVGDTHTEDVNNVTTAQDAEVGIEPDADAPAGEAKMETKKAKTNGSKKSTKKVAKPAKVAGKKAAPAKAAKAPKAPKAPKVAKAPKAEAAPKVVIGQPVSNAKIVGFEALPKNQFVLVKFDDGTGVNLWPSGYGDAKQRLAARDAMAKRLSQLL
jgi:hypothetical protein